jgi:hypothetical protein
MKAFESSVFGIEPDSSLVSLLQIVADVKEASSLKGITEVTNLCIGSSKTSEPIVGYTDGWNRLSLAAIFKHCFAEHSNLLNDVSWLSIWIRAWEDISVVKEHNFDSFNYTLMNSKSESFSNTDVDVVNIFDASWILSQVSSLPLSVSLVVWRNNDDLLSKVCETNG